MSVQIYAVLHERRHYAFRPRHRAALDAIAGPDVGDPYWAPPLQHPLAEEVGTDPGRLRIAFTEAAPTGVPVHPDCVAAVRDAAALCVHLGHEVTEASPSLDGEMLSRWFTTVWAAGTAWTIDSIAYATGLQPTPKQFGPSRGILRRLDRAVSASEYLWPCGRCSGPPLHSFMHERAVALAVSSEAL